MQKLWYGHYDGDQHNTTQENLLARADIYNIKQLKKTFLWKHWPVLETYMLIRTF